MTMGRERLRPRRRRARKLRPGQASRPRRHGRDCSGCRGAKAVRGVARGAAAALYRQRKRICDACDQKEACFIAHQKPSLQRRTLSDVDRSCPADPPRW